MKKIAVSLLATVALLAGCSGKGGSEYEGKWANLKNEKNTLEIVRNGGDNFIIKETASNFFSGKTQTTSGPATLDHGTLQVQGGFGVIAFAVDKSTGHLLGGGNEYKRLK